MTDFDELNRYYSTRSLAQLGAEIKEIKLKLEAAASAKSEIQKIYDHLTMAVVPDRMEEEMVETMKIPGVGRLQVKSDIRCACPAPNRDDLEKWLIDHNHGALISSVVNASSLKAFVKEQMKQGGDYPEELLKVSPYSRATVVKG